MTDDKFRLEARLLIGKGITDRAERMAAVSDLIDSYVGDNGGAPDVGVLDKLADYLLNEELTDVRPGKIAREGYPFLSEPQERRRRKGIFSLVDIPEDKFILGSTELLCYESEGERALREVNSAAARYHKINHKQPIITYNLREIMGDDAFDTKYSLIPRQYVSERDYRHAEWSLDVRRRDGFMCQKCGKGHAYTIHAHHIEAYNTAIDLRYDVNNGISLCRECHADFHATYGKGGNTRAQLDEWMLGLYYE
jgi:hypothetical protein